VVLSAKCGRSTVEGWTVHDLAQRLGFLPNEPDGLHVRRGNGIHQQHLDLAPERDPIGEQRF
jgi:hypothetical protein